MAHISRILAYPIKSLPMLAREQATLIADGALAGDRAYAVFEKGVSPGEASVAGGGGYVNGKSDRQVHTVSADYELAGDGDATPTQISVDVPGAGAAEFSLPDESNALADWLGDMLGYAVDVHRDPAGFQDRSRASGPTIISEATLEEVASWYDGIDSDEMCRRLRPNIVVDGVDAFWEDRLIAEPDSHVELQLGEAFMRGVNPCRRCVVPSRDPDTGAEYPDFRTRFINQRKATLPEWSGGDRFDGFFQLMTNTIVPDSTAGTVIELGEKVEIRGTVATN